MNIKISFFILISVFFYSCNSTSKESSSITFQESIDGIEVLDGENSILFYRKTIKSPNGEFFMNNYIHPLYSLKGDILTEEFPKDHLHHRGIFWAWHQIYIDTLSLGDSWIMKDVSHDVVSAKPSVIEGVAQINTHLLWKSKIYNDEEPFMEEHTTISIHIAQENYRFIDFEIAFKALVSNLHIGGSDNQKGYGGFSPRIKLPDNLVFTSETGPVAPQNLQLESGPWMDFSASFGNSKELSGLTILCHPSTPNYVAPWILRQKNSMQNIVYPGRDKVEIPMNRPLVLRYRLIVHNGNAQSIDIAKLQIEYGKVDY